MPKVTFEGVVCKVKVSGKTLHSNKFKIKTFAWLQKLKEHFKQKVMRSNRIRPTVI